MGDWFTNYNIQQTVVLALTPILTFWLSWGYTYSRERYFEWKRPVDPSVQQRPLRRPSLSSTWPTFFLEAGIVTSVAVLSVLATATNDPDGPAGDVAWWGLISGPPVIAFLVVHLTRLEQSIVIDITAEMEQAKLATLNTHRQKCMIVGYILAVESLLFGLYAASL